MNMSVPTSVSHLNMYAAIVKLKAGPSNETYSEEDWNTEVDESAEGADAYRYSKVCTMASTHDESHVDR